MTETRIVILHAKTTEAFSDGLMYRKGGQWGQESIRRHLGSGGYAVVGTMAAPDGEGDLEHVFHGSQNITSQWAKGQRSTSMGDILVVTGRKPKAFVVAAVGFDRLEDCDLEILAFGL